MAARSRRADPQLPLEDEDRAAIARDRAAAWSETERTVVRGALDFGPRRVIDLALAPEELTDRRARDVWAAAIRRANAGARAVLLDGALVAEVAQERPLDEARKSVEWIRGAEVEPDDDAVLALVDRIRDRAFCARVWSATARIREAASGGTSGGAETAAALIAELRDLAEGRHRGGQAVALQSGLEGWDAFVERARERRTTGKAIAWGLPFLDKHTLMDPGTLSVIGAESHVGKTGIMAGAVLATARKGIPAALVSLEDTWGEIVARMGAEIGKLNPMEMLEPTPALDLAERMAAARRGLVGLPVHGIKLTDRTLDTVLATIRLAASKGCKLVAVDYLTAIRRPAWLSKVATRRDAIDESLAALLSTAADRGVHLMLGVQLNRDKNRARVSLNDLRESQAIGESAQNVIGLARGKGKTILCDLVKAKGTGNAGRYTKLQRDSFGVLGPADGESFNGNDDDEGDEVF